MFIYDIIKQLVLNIRIFPSTPLITSYFYASGDEKKISRHYFVFFMSTCSEKYSSLLKKLYIDIKEINKKYYFLKTKDKIVFF